MTSSPTLAALLQLCDRRGLLAEPSRNDPARVDGTFVGRRDVEGKALHLQPLCEGRAGLRRRRRQEATQGGAERGCS